MPKTLTNVRSIKFGGKKGFTIANQPAGKAAFVSEEPDTLTIFEMARKHGVHGFLAHNYLAGKSFSSVKVNQRISVTDENGKDLAYKVKRIEKFQALDPQNPRSDFINLQEKEQCTASDLFKRIYTGNNRLVLQTCIAKDGDEEWGRMFIIAEPEADDKKVKTIAKTRRNHNL